MPKRIQILGKEKTLNAKFNKWQKGLLFAMIAPFFYSLKSVVVKVAPQANVETFVFLRFFFDFLILTPFFIKHRKKIGTKKIHMHFVRAIIVVVSAACSVYGLKKLVLIDAILLETTVPLFIPLIFFIWFKRKISKKSFFILLAGFSAVFFLLKPKLDISHFASLASLAVGFTVAITSIFIRYLSKTEHSIAILFYYYLFSSLISSVPCLYSWEGNFPPSFWAYIVLISIFGVLFQYSATRAYSLILPHVVGCFVYFNTLYSTIFGWLIWKESLDIFQVLGGSILILSGILIILENKKFEEIPSEIISKKVES